MKSKVFEPYFMKSKCCNDSVSYFRTKDIGYPKCGKCGKQCDIIEPKNKAEKFQHEIEHRIKTLDYYEPNKRQSNFNFEKMQLLEEVLDVWQKIYYQ